MVHRAVASSIIGHGAVIERLQDAAQRAGRGEGNAVIVEGEAGAGKTTIVGEFARRTTVAHGEVCWSRCRADGDAPAFWPWAQLLEELLPAGRADARSVIGDDAWCVLAIAPALAARLDLPTSAPDAGRVELFEACARIVERIAAVTPIVPIVDDLQWADVASTLLLAYLVPRLAGARALFVATLRTGEPMSDAMRAACADVRRNAPAISLTGFDDAAIGRLLDEAGVAFDAALVDTLATRTRGNPFFVTRLVANLAQTQLGESGPTARGLRLVASEVPTEVAEVVGRRAARLASPVADVVSAAAVLGDEGSLSALADVAGIALDETFVRVEAAEGLLEEHDERFAFTHALVRDAVYANLAPKVRRHLHLRALGALGSDPGAANARARHALAALPLGDRDVAVTLVVEAADLAREHLAYEEAADRYASALRAGGSALRPREEASLLVREGECRREAGETAATRPLFLDAAGLLTDADTDLLARAALGYADPGADLGLAYQSNDPHTLALLERAIVAQGDADTAIGARLRARGAAELYFSSEPERSRPLSEAAVAMAHQVGDPRTLVVALAGHHDAFVVGQVAATDALTGSGEILRHARTSGHPLALLAAHRARVFDLVAMGDFDGVAAEIAAFTRIADAQPAPAFRWWPTLWQAMLALLHGRHGEAERHAFEAYALGEHPFGGLALTNLSFALFFLARERGQLGAYEDATRAFALEHAEIPAIRAALAMLLAETGKLDEARGIVSALASDGFARLQDRNWPASWFQLARTAYLTGDAERARSLLVCGRPLGGECVMVSLATVCLGSAELAYAWLAEASGDLDVADEAYRRAAGTNARISARSWLAQTRVDHAALLVARGQREEGAALAELALAVATDSGLVPVEQRARTLVAAAGTHSGPARMRRDGTVWELTFADRTARVAHAKGVADLAWLVARPGEPVAAAELIARQQPGAPVDAGRGDLVLDDRARRELREHLVGLDTELADAHAAHDIERAARVAAQRDAVLEAAADALGLGGRSRRMDDAAERARKAVTARIRNAVDRIGAAHPELGAHLERSVDTGTWCTYRPERPVEWDV